MRKLLCAVVMCGALAACVDPNSAQQPGQLGVNNTTGGTLIGAGLGGLLGSQFGSGSGKAVATVAGVLAGGFIGNRIGNSMDQAQARATQTALETGQPGQPLPWQNPDNGKSGTVTPGKYTQDASGQYCREFTQTINVGGDSQPQQGYGKACRQPDGTWKIDSN
jgi:surface antigen